MPADAGQSFDIKHTICRHLTPLADGTRRYAKLSGDTGLCPAPLFLKEFLDINHEPVVAQLKPAAKRFATLGQIRDVLVQFLRQYPDIRHQPAGLLAYAALLTAFPCRR